MRALVPAARALLAACHPEPAAFVVVLAGGLAIAGGRAAGGVVAVVAAVAAGQLSVGWHNDWLDAARDRRAGRGDKPVASGAVARGTVRTAALVALAATVPLSLLSGWRAGCLHVAAVLVAWAYNARLKATVLSWLPYAVAFPLLVAFVVVGRDGRWPPAWQLVAAALLAVGAHLANAAPDVDDDLADGVRGLPARLGPLRAVRTALVLLVAATAVVTAAAPGPATAVTAGLSVVVVALAAGLGRRSVGVAFRAAMAVAALDAAGLVVGAGR